MHVHDRNEGDDVVGAAGYLARYRELEASGHMPGLSLARTNFLAGAGGGPRPPRELLSRDSELASLVFALMPGPSNLQDEDGLLRSAVLGFGIATGNRAGVCGGFPYDEFWSLSLASGVAAQALSRQLGVGRPAVAFLCGFLYRIGALALSSAFPDEYSSIGATSPIEAMDDLRGLERDRFGIDHVELSHALLLALGFHESVHGVIAGLASGTSTQGSELGPLVLAGERIACLCTLGEDAREERWLDLVDLRREMNLERDAFSELGDTVIRRWWDWGDRLQIRTQPLPSFYALDHTAVVDRRGLGLVNLRDRGRDRSLKILVVDDEPTAVLLLRAQLERGGHKVLTATNGSEALSIALQHTPDVVVADWVMPRMDGLELCRALRRCEAGRHLYFFLVTGREEDDDVIEAFDAGVDDFVTKPSTEGLLLARMKAARRVLDLRQQINLDQRLLKRQLTRMSALARQAREAAVTDSLTELPNRRYATRRLSEEWASSERVGSELSLVMLDVDHFKRINDTYGHEVGDDVLRALADVLEGTTRQNEVACRFGGEEFVVICSNTGERGARACGERIRAAIEAQVGPAVGLDQAVTASVGVATRRQGTDDVAEFVRQADRAVYLAKEKGRNRTCFDDPPAPLPAEGGVRGEDRDPIPEKGLRSRGPSAEGDAGLGETPSDPST
jgi:diguanylate cyclase (GGDEF)-like protein